MLTKQAILEWIEIYKNKTGKEISFEEASVRANKMFSFLRLITKPASFKVNVCSQSKKAL